jgi:Reverse transcriptase (RNA-dependent DNA polymerase)
MMKLHKQTSLANAQMDTNYTFPDNDFTETIKEQQDRYVTQTQFQPPTPLLSPPLNKLAKLKEENHKWHLETHISHLEEQIKWTTTTNNVAKTLESTSYPMPPPTPPKMPPTQINELVHQIDINETTAATQWAIDAAKPTKKEELPREYQWHWRVFSEKLAQRFPPSQKDDHTIKLKPGALDSILNRAYKWTPKEDKVGREWLKENEDMGYIEKGDSPWATPCFFVKKKDGKFQPIQDYHTINEWTIPDTYPLPQIKTILEQLEGKALFTTLNICWGYNNICIKQEDQWKAAFITPYGLYIPKVMPFGLHNTPATFQWCMYNTFRDILNHWPENVFIYMDNFLITTPNRTEQDRQLHQTITHVVLQRFEDQSFFLKAAKCHFEKTCVNYLGIVVEDGKITLDPVKQRGLLEWPTEQSTVSGIHSMLGVFGYH